MDSVKWDSAMWDMIVIKHYKSLKCCIICYETVPQYIITKCNHIMCHKCYVLLNQHSTDDYIHCPMCRQRIVAKTVLNKKQDITATISIDNSVIQYAFYSEHCDTIKRANNSAAGDAAELYITEYALTRANAFCQYLTTQYKNTYKKHCGNIYKKIINTVWDDNIVYAYSIYPTDAIVAINATNSTAIDSAIDSYKSVISQDSDHSAYAAAYTAAYDIYANTLGNLTNDKSSIAYYIDNMIIKFDKIITICYALKQYYQKQDRERIDREQLDRFIIADRKSLSRQRLEEAEAGERTERTWWREWMAQHKY